MAQLMPLPLTVSCFSKIQIGFSFLVPAHLGSPGKRAVKWVYVLFGTTQVGRYWKKQSPTRTHPDHQTRVSQMQLSVYCSTDRKWQKAHLAPTDLAAEKPLRHSLSLVAL